MLLVLFLRPTLKQRYCSIRLRVLTFLLCMCRQAGDDTDVLLGGFGTVVNALGLRVKPYLPQICGTIKWRLNNKNAKTRMQAADLIARIAVVMRTCEEEQLMGHLGVVLYEYLGEEYPEVICAVVVLCFIMKDFTFCFFHYCYVRCIHSSSTALFTHFSLPLYLFLLTPGAR